MTKNLRIAMMLFGVLSAATTTYAESSGCTAADEAAIRKLAADFDAEAKKHDASTYANFFAENVDWENAFGNHTSGREALAKGMTKVMQTFSAAEEKVTGVRVDCLRPDFALVDIYQTIENQKTPKGNEIPTRHVRMTQIYEKRGEAWTIRAHRVADLRGKNKEKDGERPVRQ